MKDSEMRAAATVLLAALPGDLRDSAALPFGDDHARRWLEYRPRPRPGVSLAGLAPDARKAAHRLLATGLSPHAYAQAMAVAALEEVLDRQEGWRRGRHSEDFWVSVFGDPQADDARSVLRPLGNEEDLARALLAELSPADRAAAIVADEAPDDIHSATRPSSSVIEPYG